ncbi:MAG: hypothetical protein RBT74_11880 [Tenuifilaceae bacterium]|jgi:hypothetical protein|nr:hypothetical protein [Tenuifilaceae bacterium]
MALLSFAAIKRNINDWWWGNKEKSSMLGDSLNAGEVKPRRYLSLRLGGFMDSSQSK